MPLSKTILTIPAVNGTVERSPNFLGFNHHLGIKTDVPGTGTLQIEARPPGAEAFEPIPGAEALSLGLPVSVQVTGIVEEYQITVSGVSGASVITITDSCEVP